MAIRLHIVVWNLHGVPTAPRLLRRFRAAAAEIRRRAPEVVLLQEVWRPQEAQLLRSDLPTYAAVDPPRGGALGRAGGLLTLVSRSSGWSIAAHSFERFRDHAPAWKLWQGDGLAEKGILRVELERGDARVVLLNTHLQASYGPGGYASVRRAQLRQLGRAALAEDPLVPLIAAGDLNTRPHEAHFEEITRAFTELTAPLRERCGCGTLPGRDGWLDYVVARASPHWAASADVVLIPSERRDYPFSDHHGLDARVSFEPPAEALDPGQAIRGPSSRRVWLRGLVGWIAERSGLAGGWLC